VGFAEQRAQAERAMEARHDESPAYPPTAARFRAAFERTSISASELAVRCGVEKTLYWHLERYDSEVFDCVDVAQLPRIAAVLQVSVMQLLFGAQPPEPLAQVSYTDLARRLREEAARRKIDLDAFGTIVGWELEGLVGDPETLGELNLVGLYDVCRAAAVDWLCVLAWVEERAAEQR
jgi:hypothetical protein